MVLTQKQITLSIKSEDLKSINEFRVVKRVAESNFFIQWLVGLKHIFQFSHGIALGKPYWAFYP